jgi:hypothetical protein
MTVTHVVGIDPGLVHTGVVSMLFKSDSKEIVVTSHAVPGLDAAQVRDLVVPLGQWPDRIFIEGYKPRSNLNSDKRMIEGITKIKARLPSAKVLDNMGVKKVVKKSLMDLLGVWSFTTTTHHQDLRSAARIALLGMLKDDELNLLLADVVRDHLNGDDWRVV